MESNNNPSTTTTSNGMSQKAMERHMATQSHANGTTMGQFPQLILVQLGLQVPAHMMVSGTHLPEMAMEVHISTWNEDVVEKAKVESAMTPGGISNVESGFALLVVNAE